jgi:hypothetical protein
LPLFLLESVQISETIQTMKLLTLVLSAGLSFAVATIARSEEATKPESGVDEKTRKEVLEIEKQLGVAITKGDVTLLDKLLADYYADSYEGGEGAVSKKGTMARCRAGTLPYYALNEKPELSRSAEMVTIEAVSKASATSSNDTPKESVLRVKRVWTKKDGRWLLVAQKRGPAEDEEREKGEKH